MAIFLQINIIIIYLISILTLSCISLRDHPYSALFVFVLSHLSLYLIVFYNNTKLSLLNSISIKSILLIAILLRSLFFLYPASDDLSRYAWEGKKVSQGINPYIHAPLWLTTADIQGMMVVDKQGLVAILESWNGQKLNVSNEKLRDKKIVELTNQFISDKNFLVIFKNNAEAKDIKYFNSTQMSKNELIQNNRELLAQNFKSLGDNIQTKVNHKEMSSIYPPVSILVSAVLMKISYSTLPYKILFFICDLIIILFIVMILRKLEKPVHWALIYVMSPLVLLYGVGECHLDILQNVLLIAGIYFLSYSKLKRMIAIGFFLLGCAVLTKFLAIIAVPFLLNRKNISFLLFFLLPFASYFLFIESGMWDSLEFFYGTMHFNDAMPRLLRFVASEGSIGYQLLIPCIYSLGYVLIFLLFQDNPLKGILYAWVWLILCLPALHPWYLLPHIFLICFYPKRFIFYLSLIMGLYFFVVAFQQSHQGAWVEFWWLPVYTYLGLAVAFLIEKNWFVPIDGCEYSMIKSIDVILPVYNESEKINKSLKSLFAEIERLKIHHRIDVNVMVVDGKSTDNTLSILEKFPVKVGVCEERGRGNQLAQGFEMSRSELILFLHADSVLKPNALTNMLEAFHKTPNLAWGVLGHIYDVKMFKLKIIENLNMFRFKYMGIAFGDQGMFFRREVLEIVKVPKIPLMEDVEISLRLSKFPSRINLNGLIVASSRRWERRIFVKSVLQVIFLCAKYLVYRSLGADTVTLSKKIYKIYYS